jgi:DHA3 family macrolide efflux protein-like MFS transporter
MADWWLANATEAGLRWCVPAFVMVSGALLTVASLPVILMIDVLTAASAIIILLLFIPIPTHEKAQIKPTGGYYADMKDGFKYIAGHRFVKLFFLFTLAFNMMAAPVAFMTPLQVTRSFGPDYWRLTAIEVAFSAGMMAGGGIIAAWGGFKNRIHTISAASASGMTKTRSASEARSNSRMPRRPRVMTIIWSRGS